MGDFRANEDIKNSFIQLNTTEKSTQETISVESMTPLILKLAESETSFSTIRPSKTISRANWVVFQLDLSHSTTTKIEQLKSDHGGTTAVETTTVALTLFPTTSSFIFPTTSTNTGIKALRNDNDCNYIRISKWNFDL